jgi:iron complex transport system ATP-binding protein
VNVPALSARLREVRLQRHRVLGAMTLDLPAGRWTAIVGPNGAGKSTLLRTLAGLQRFDGEVHLQGRPLRDWPARARARTLAWLGQDEGGADELSAHDVVMLGRLPHQGWLAPPSAADRAAVRGAMARTQSWDWRERRLGSLSGGERQRVLLARTLAVQANVVLMDEPLSHLDPPHQADWLDLVLAQVAEGVTVVSVLHEVNTALLVDVLVVMAGGQVLYQGRAQADEARDALQAVFDQRLRFGQIEGRWLALPQGRPAGERP